MLAARLSRSYEAGGMRSRELGTSRKGGRSLWLVILFTKGRRAVAASQYKNTCVVTLPAHKRKKGRKGWDLVRTLAADQNKLHVQIQIQIQTVLWLAPGWHTAHST